MGVCSLRRTRSDIVETIREPPEKPALPAGTTESGPKKADSGVRKRITPQTGKTTVFVAGTPEVGS